MNARLRLLTIFVCLISLDVFGLEIDLKLKKIIEINELHLASSCKENLQSHDVRLVQLGKKLFQSQQLSGDRDTSCSTCHIDSLELTDGLALAVGVGGKGESMDRLVHGEGTIVPRNAFTLRGRGHKLFSTYFWDGRVQKRKGIVISPFGEELDDGFQSPLAIASVLPLLARDEFLGRLSFFNENSSVSLVNDKFYQDRYLSATELYRNLFLESTNAEVRELAALISESGLKVNAIRLSDIGNALASFISAELSCTESPWNSYLSGDAAALTLRQKEGALLFYGKGRCSACHSGPLLSDFAFHSIATPQGEFGTDILGRDLGLAQVSVKAEDRFLFRTPPLLKVSMTAPYGHNGVFESLRDVVVYHMNPLIHFSRNEWSSDREKLSFGKILQQRSGVLGYIDIVSEDQVELLLEFLNTL